MTVVLKRKIDINGFHSILTQAGTVGSAKNFNEPSIDLFKDVAIAQVNNAISNHSRFNDSVINNFGERNLILIKKALITFRLYKEDYFGKNKKKRQLKESANNIENTLVECDFEEDIEIGQLKKKRCTNSSGKRVNNNFVLETPPSSMSNNTSSVSNLKPIPQAKEDDDNKDTMESEVDDSSSIKSFHDNDSDKINNYIKMPIGRFIHILKADYGSLDKELSKDTKIQEAHFGAIVKIFQDPKRSKDRGVMLEWLRLLYPGFKVQFGTSNDLVLKGKEYFSPAKVKGKTLYSEIHLLTSTLVEKVQVDDDILEDTPINRNQLLSNRYFNASL